MLRTVSAVLAFAVLSAAAHADTYKCRNTFTNKTGETAAMTATAGTSGTMIINGKSQDVEDGDSFNFDLGNGEKSEVEHDHSGAKGCNLTITALVPTNTKRDKLNMRSVASSSNNTRACTVGDTTKGFYAKYKCSCQKEKGAHHADITMTCNEPVTGGS